VIETRYLLLGFIGGSAIVSLARFLQEVEATATGLEILMALVGLFAVWLTFLHRKEQEVAPIVKGIWETFGATVLWYAMVRVSPWTAGGLWVIGTALLFVLRSLQQHELIVPQGFSAEARAEITRLERIIQEMNGASGQVKDAIDSQTDSVDNQSAAIAEIATALSEINVTSQQASEQAQSVVATADTSEQISRQGIESVSQNIDGLHRISEQVEAITANIFDLNEQTNQIGEIVATSSELAERSHVLALNASVEAARSGEAGKGFQVVAQEMKNLSRQSKQATERIRRILGEIQRATQQVVTATEEGSRRVTAGIHLAQQAGEIIRQLSQVISGSAGSARLIATASRQLSGGIEQISTAMGELTNLTGGIVSVGKNAEQAVQTLGVLSNELMLVATQLRLEGQAPLLPVAAPATTH
jgi:ABC-type transporter Mla subunit MlaD